MKNVLQIAGAMVFGLVIAFAFMKVTSVPEITFTHLPTGEKVVWEARQSDGTEMSIQDAEKLIETGGRYVESYQVTPTAGHRDQFGFNLGLEPFNVGPFEFSSSF